jgi:chemotaxis protein MotB
MHGWRLTIVASCMASALVAGGCVTQGKYDRTVAAWSAAVRARDERMAALDAALAQARADSATRDRTIATLDTARSNAVRALDEATAIDAHLRDELRRLGRDVDSILAERGTLQHALDDARARLDELRAAQRAAERRAALFASLVERLRVPLDAHALAVAVRDGRIVVRIPVDALFDADGRALRPTARPLLHAVAVALVAIGDRRFEVGVHDDGTGADREGAWLSTAVRAVRVARALVDEGVPGRALSAAGYGDHDPLEVGDGADVHAHNRRVEIVLRPEPIELAPSPSPSASAS